MARNNGSRASRASAGGQQQGRNASRGEHARSQQQERRNGTTASAGRRVGGGGAGGGGGGRSSSKSSPAASPTLHGYAAGRRGGMAAVESIKPARSRAVEAAGEHPLPLALIGAGLAWWLMESRGFRPTEAHLIERSREALGGVG